jgi:hypothetical protein
MESRWRRMKSSREQRGAFLSPIVQIFWVLSSTQKGKWLPTSERRKGSHCNDS